MFSDVPTPASLNFPSRISSGKVIDCFADDNNNSAVLSLTEQFGKMATDGISRSIILFMTVFSCPFIYIDKKITPPSGEKLSTAEGN